MKGKKTQMGYCKNVKVFSSVQIIGTSQVSLNALLPFAFVMAFLAFVFLLLSWLCVLFLSWLL